MRGLLILVCVLVAGSQANGGQGPGTYCYLKNLFGVHFDIEKYVSGVDVNNDGLVSIGLQEDKNDVIKMDANKDGKTSRNEFVNYFQNNLCYPKHLASMVFDQFDWNKDGLFTGDDIVESYFDANGQSNATSLKNFLRQIDSNAQAEAREREMQAMIIKNKYDGFHFWQ